MKKESFCCLFLGSVSFFLFYPLSTFYYVFNNPSSTTDPTGHSPCYDDNYDDGPQCARAGSPSQWYYDQIKYQRDCAAGKSEWCPGGAAGLAAWGATGTVVAGLSSYALLEGSAGAVVDAAASLLDFAGVACLQSPLCRRVLGAPGGAGTAPDPNAIGSWGVNQVEDQDIINAGQHPVYNPELNKLRIYDGTMAGDNSVYAEIKTSTQGTVYATSFIRNQIVFDAIHVS